MDIQHTTRVQRIVTVEHKEIWISLTNSHNWDGNDGQAGKILYQNFILAFKTNSAETFIGLKCSKFIFTFLCSVWEL